SLVVTIICSGRASSQLQTVGPVLANGSKGHALVSVEVGAVKRPAAGPAEATLKVVRVYSGPQKLKGSELRAETGDQGRTSGYLISPSLRVEETGIAALHFKEHVSAWRVRGVARKDRMPDYDGFVEWAEAVEALSKKEADKRLNAARDLCASTNPRVAQLGLEVLFTAPPEDAKRAGLGTFIADLPGAKGVSVSALVLADRLLFDRDGRSWLDSERRKRLVANLVEPLGDHDVEAVAGHIIGSRYFQSPNGTWFTADVARALLVKLTTDPRQSLAVRNAAVDQLVRVSNGAAKPGFTFEVLAAVVRCGPDALGRLHGAKGLGAFVWSGSEREALFVLRQGEKDADVATALDAAIKKSSPNRPVPPREP
ncbi:MAG TPA: hypothetical protein VGE74_18475, partial [Gemmata sp.]